MQGSFVLTLPERIRCSKPANSDYYREFDEPQHKGLMFQFRNNNGQIKLKDLFPLEENKFRIDNDYYYENTDTLIWFYWSCDEYGNALCSDFFDSTWKDLDEVEVLNYSLSKDSKNHLAITFNFAEDTWEKFDKIKFTVYNQSSGLEKEIYYIEKNEMSYTYKRNNNYYYDEQTNNKYFFYDNSCYFSFQGKNGSYTHEKITEIFARDMEIDEKQYDDEPPVINVMKTNGFKYLRLYAKDIGNGTGPVATGGKITLKGDIYYNYNLNAITNENGQSVTEVYAEIPMDIIRNRSILVFEDDKIKLPYEYTVRDEAGNENSYCKAEFEIDVVGEAGISGIHKKDGENDRNYINFANDFNGSGHDFEVYVYNADTFGNWDKINIVETERQKVYLNDSVDLTDKFVKVLHLKNKDDGTVQWSHPGYKYSGRQNSKEVDYILPNGDGNSGSVIVCSDAPVLLHCFSTKLPEEICSKWTVEQWCFWGNEAYPSIINFAEDNETPRTYTIGTSGNKSDCFVFIAHFADGTALKTGVMKRK